jgi:prolyl-tRNA synthetase
MAKMAVLTSQADDFPRWYQDVLAKAELAENGPVRGTIVIRPYGYAIWERVQSEIDQRIKSLGVANAYFPLFIPQSYFRKEAEHVEGFAPELAVVTYGGGKELEEPVVVRPTSETVINVYFAKWIQSHRDLPMLLNQWANVVRWELRPRLFLRGTEFLWQEGHTAHASEDEARAFALRVLDEVYRDFMVEVMAIPVLTGRKTARERFAGAETTWTCEGMMRDAKALQMGTSHELGQNFSRPFDITFLDEDGGQSFAWQTSWGASTRLMGALVMAHGDDAGLRLPPRLAPVQVVVLVARAEEQVGEQAESVGAALAAAGLRVQVDDRVESSFGRRVVDWELKGVPVRVEMGPRDLERGEAVLVRRQRASKEAVPLAALVPAVQRALEETQTAMLEEATSFRSSRTTTVSTVDEAIEACAEGFATLPLPALGHDGEDRANAAGVSVRCLLGADGGPPRAGEPDERLVAVLARAY